MNFQKVFHLVNSSHDASAHSYQEIEEIISLYEEPNVIAAGEMGLDFFLIIRRKLKLKYLNVNS